MVGTVLRYEVEMVLPSLEGRLKWKHKSTFVPHYSFEDRPVRHRFLWWTWITSRDVITNEKKARTNARRKAFRTAKKLFPIYNVRVIVVFKFPEVNESIRHCVWENGNYFSTH